MKCPCQTAFAKHLDELLCLYYETLKLSSHEDFGIKLIDKFLERRKRFVNLWCPTYKEYEEF